MSKLFPLPNKGILFPFYHLVAEQTPIHVKNLYKAKTPSEFRKDLDFLTKNYKIWSWDECENYLKSDTKEQADAVHLSFDDGLSECHDLIAPILAQYGIKATFFINSAFVDNRDLMYRYKESILVETAKHKNSPYTKEEILGITYIQKEKLNSIAKELNVDFKKYLKENQPYMTSSQIQSLKNEGHTIGAHSVDHPYFNEIPLQKQLEQTMESVDYVESNFQSSPKVFAFPFTDYGVDQNYFEPIKNKVNYTFSTAGVKNDLYSWNINRFSAEGGPLKKIIALEKLKFMLRNTLKIRNEHN